MQNITTVISVFPIAFIFQSLFILLFKRSIFMKIVPRPDFRYMGSCQSITRIIFSNIGFMARFPYPFVDWRHSRLDYGISFPKAIDKEYKEMTAKYEEEFGNDNAQTK